MSETLQRKRDEFRRWTLLRAIERTEGELRAAAARQPDFGASLNELLARTAKLRGRLDHGDVRVGVIGAVKSGKSTLVNALLGEDLLPRGSGILTAQVTRVRTGAAPGAKIRWKSRDAVNRDFAAHLEGMGAARPPNHPAWDIDAQADRDRACALLERPGSGPHREPLEALLNGYGNAPWHRAGRDAEERAGSTEVAEVAAWAGRDEVAAYLDGLDLDVAAHEVPHGLTVLDCQGSDAWNAAHHAGVEQALMDADALVYVVSSRVGLREADFRLIQALRGYGLLDATRFVMNVDLGEVRAPGELARLHGDIQRRLTQEGALGRLWRFSALHALLEHRMLLDPESVWEGEQRLLEVWKGHFSDFLVESAEAFDGFRDELWGVAAGGRSEALSIRTRGELRRILVEAARHAGGLGAAARRGEAAEKLFAWAQAELDKAVEFEKQRIRAALEEAFGGRAAPQRQVWKGPVEGFSPDSRALLEQSGGDPAAAAARYKSVLADFVTALLRQSEPVRVNAARNLALEARGTLARRGEELAAQAAERLREAGYPVDRAGDRTAGAGGSPPPDRAGFSREITITRKVPLFVSRVLDGEETAREGATETGERLVGRALRWLGRRTGSGSGAKLLAAEAARLRTTRLHELRRHWEAYRAALSDQCLLPHVEEAAGQVYGRLASWILLQTVSEAGEPGEGLADALAQMEDESAGPPNETQ